MVAAALVCLLAASEPAIARSEDGTHIDPVRLTFGILRASGIANAPAQVVFIQRRAPSDGGSWKAAVDRPWLEVTPSGGRVPAPLRVRLRRANLPPGDSDDATIVVSGDRPSAWRETVVVHLEIAARDDGPIGFVDRPAEHALAGAGRLRVEGWALDDVGLKAIEICRSAPAGSDLPPCADGRGVRIGSADPYAIPRPDVAALFSRLPRSVQAGWACDFDTTAWPRRQQGSFSLHVVASDVAGHLVTIGDRQITVDPTPTIGVLSSLYFLWLPAIGLLAFLLLHYGTLGVARYAPDSVGTAASDVAANAVDRYIAILIACGATVLAVRAGGGLTYDELFTYAHFVGGASLWQSATGIGVFNNHIANSLLANLSVRLFGPTDGALRLPAAALGAAGIYALWRLVRDFAPPTTALLAAALFAFSPMQQEWSYAARGYAGLAALCIVSTRTYFQLRSGVTSRWVPALYVGSTIGCVYFNLYGVWVIAVQYAIWLTGLPRAVLTRTVARRLWWSFLGVAVGVVVLYAPVAEPLSQVAAMRGRTPIAWHFPLDLFRAVFGITDSWQYLAVVLLVGVGLFRLRRHAALASYMVTLLLVPLAAVWLIARPQDLFPRLFHFWSPFAAVIVAAGVTGVEGPPRTAGRRLATGVLLAAASLLVAVWVRNDLAERPGGGYRSFLRAELMNEPAGVQTLLAGPDADILSFYLRRPATIISSSAAFDRQTREQMSPFLLVFHHPGWETPEEIHIRDLAVRRCRAAEGGLVSLYRCGE